LLLPLPLRWNISLASLRKFSRLGVITARHEDNVARDYQLGLRVRCRDRSQPCSELSGGNQQKILLARWLNRKPRILILDEPTRGVDVGAKQQIYNIMADLAARGIAILMISSELPEILRMSDRILVMREGKITAEINDPSKTSEEEILGYASR
jgi:L-arabinose transport system ATP-binding protein